MAIYELQLNSRQSGDDHSGRLTAEVVNTEQ